MRFIWKMTNIASLMHPSKMAIVHIQPQLATSVQHKRKRRGEHWKFKKKWLMQHFDIKLCQADMHVDKKQTVYNCT